MIAVSERGLTSTDWTVYNDDTKRTQYSTVPTSNITAETVVVDGFALSLKDTAGITSTATRSFTAGGMVFTQTDGRGNASTTVTDTARRPLSVTDAAGNVTTTAYDAAHDEPAMITDAQGNTTCYRYDIRGRKVAEWGSGVQPACFGYDDADHLVSLMTFRAGTETISTDPSERTDADETTWRFDAATGLELGKTYADDSSVVKTYDSFNRLATVTDARGIVKTHSYETARGLLLGTTYSDTTTPRSYTYNHLGQLTQVTDDAGTRTIGYNAFGEQETDSLLAGDITHLITETRDAMGRSTGFTYAKNGAVQHTVTTGYGTDGRINSAGFLHGGAEKQFGYGYLPGSDLLQSLTLPSNMTLTQSYETQRDLLIGMAYRRGSTLVAQRTYTYDSLGRPLTRSTARNGQTVNDSFVHNSRSELTGATVNGCTYGYAYDNIGNRNTATEGEEVTAYTTNNLNQYTSIQENEEAAFVPTFDADGNQTLVKTSTGIWSVQYNAENRPVRFTSADGATIIECSYDTHGRRATKKVTTNGSITLHQRYIYRGYLQLACCDLTRTGHPCLWLLTWDPTQPVATRPLAIRKDGTWYAYGWDLTKNICEVFGQHGYLRTAYSYSPYGEVTADGDVTQPIQWSSEHNDTELALIYYNYRHYNPLAGRWIGRDMLGENGGHCLYSYSDNKTLCYLDVLGLDVIIISGGIDINGGEHDNNWKNFIDSASRKIEEVKRNAPNEKIDWLIESDTYKDRYAYDLDKLQKSSGLKENLKYYCLKFKGSYIGIIEELAKELGVNLRFYTNKAELKKYINSDVYGIPRKQSSVSNVSYFGHGYPHALSLNINDSSHDLTYNEIKNEGIINSKYLTQAPNIELYTCHSASTEPSNGVNISIAETLSNLYPNSRVIGYHGRINYEPVAKGGMPVPGTTFRKNVIRGGFKKPQQIIFGRNK